MSNKTLIPALKAKVGDWNYYICVMKYAQIAKECSFAYELGGNPKLNELLQRGITERTQGIVDYLIRSEHRFLGSLIVAAWGGHPQYIPVKMDETDDLTHGLDSGFGILTFDGSQQYFALDGQHRLKAIKEAIKRKPELGNEDISVILVSHFNTEEGKERTRRLFSNINKNAKATSSTENIILDEDDACAVINRRLVNEHEKFSQDGVVAIYRKQAENGELSVATSVSNSDKRAIISLKQLYEIVKSLRVQSPIEDYDPAIRPSDDILEESYTIISARVEKLFKVCGDVYSLIDKPDIRIYRKNKLNPEKEHAFLKGIIQRTVAEVISGLVKEGSLTWEECFIKLSQLNWEVGDQLWSCVVQLPTSTEKENGKNVSRMLTSRDFVDLLNGMLRVYLAPKSKAEIKRIRTSYYELRARNYSLSEEQLSVNIK